MKNVAKPREVKTTEGFNTNSRNKQARVKTQYTKRKRIRIINKNC